MKYSGLKLRSERLLWVGLLVVLLLAAALRFYRLDGQSLWADEGNSVALAGRSLAEITYGAAYDIHPPLYYYLLHFWMRSFDWAQGRPFGSKEFAVRSLSAVIGTLLVCLTFLLGRRLFDSWVGLVAAFLSAVSPFQVYYSQEARMYILLAALSALSVYFFLRFLEAEADTDCQQPLFLWAGLYTPAAVLALYTHYSFPFVLLVENLFYVLWLAIRWRSAGRVGETRRIRRVEPVETETKRRGAILGRVWRWAALQLAVILLFGPWLPTAYRQVTTWPAPHQAYPLLPTLANVYRLLCLGLSVETLDVVGALVIFAFFILAGSFPALDEDGDEPTLALPWLLRYGLVALWTALPTVLIFALGLFRETHLKFLLVSSPPFSLLVGLGIVNTWRIASDWRAGLGRSELGQPAARVVVLLLVAFMLLASGQSLLNYYYDPQYARDDYRGLARYIAATAGPDDAIILNAPGQQEIFGYYYPGDLPVYPLPQQRPLDPEQTGHDLEAIVSQHAKIFAVLWATDESDPGRFVEGWLDERTYKALDTWYGNVRLAIYAAPQAGLATEMAHPLSANLGDKVMLLGYSLLSEEVYAGGTLELTLFWQALTALDERYMVFIHVLDADGHIVGQRDTEPGGGAMLTTTWQPGQTIADNYGVLISHGTPPGEYQVKVGMYALDSGTRLPASRAGQPSGGGLALEPICIVRPKTPPPLEALDIPYRESLDYGDLKLLGYSFYKLGYAHQKEEPLHPGDILHLDLYWQAVHTPDTDWQLGWQLVDREGQSWAVEEKRPIGGSYGTRLWQAGEVVRDQYDLLIPPGISAGRYHLAGQLRPSVESEVLSPPFESKELVIR